MATSKKTTASTTTEIESEKETITATQPAEADSVCGSVGVSRVPVAELEAKLNEIGYDNVLQIIVEPSYSGAYFVVVYKK